MDFQCRWKKNSQTQLSEHEHESFIWIIFYGTGAHIILQAYFSLIVHVYDFRISETFNFGCHCSCSHVCLCVGGVRARARLRCHTVCTKIPTILPFVCTYAFHVDMLLVEPTKLGRIRTRKIIISLVHCQHAALLSIEIRQHFFVGSFCTEQPNELNARFPYYSLVLTSSKVGKKKSKRRLNKIISDRMRTRRKK